MSLLDRLLTKDGKQPNNLSLIGNNLSSERYTPSFGFAEFSNPDLDPRVSKLHFTYSVNYKPSLRIIDFNKSQYSSYLPYPSSIDELDPNAPNLNPVGVVSQVYKSKSGRQYRDLGPLEGRY